MRSVGSFAYFRKQIVPLEEANVNIMTHALNYGTGCFEGIRGNWNPLHEQLYLFRMREHYERLKMSAQLLRIEIDESIDELCDLTVELVRRSGFKEDVYIRPLAFKSAEEIGVRLHNLEDDLTIFVAPFGNYVNDAGIRCRTSSWRRVSDTAIPSAAKATGKYLNNALAKTEAAELGYDEAIMLTELGNVSEGSGENIFVVSRGQLVTPDPAEQILVGITRNTVMQLASEEMGLQTIERPIPRSELFTSEECFMTGTAAHLTPVLEIDNLPVGNGQTGPITRQLKDRYQAIIRGNDDKFAHWCTAVSPVAVSA
jgi:branched-chain amino acid aminotransferase